MNKKELFYPSANGEEEIKAYIFYPMGENLRAVIQIAHGMCEHVLRYDEFIEYLTEKGFIVCGNDHLGHGYSHSGLKGYMGEKDGYIHMVDDMHTLQQRVAREVPGFSYYFMGHSMGSFLLRSYVTKYGDSLDGIILSGTGQLQGFRYKLMTPMLSINNLIIRIKGGRALAKSVSWLSSGLFKRHFTPTKTKADWQTRDGKKAQSFLDDELCRFTFTYAGYRDLLLLMQEVYNPKWVSQIPGELPILIVSGDDDPIGSYGKGTKLLYDNLIAAGLKDVILKNYKEGRHEMLNEINREDVYEDIFQWIEKRL